MKAYKDSGIKWLGKIPAHWEVSRIKHIFKERIEFGFENETLLVSSQKMGVVPKNIYGNRTVEATKNLHLLKLVKVEDFVISLRSFQGGIEYAYYQGIISPAYTILEISSKKLLKDYFKHLAKSQSFISLLQSYKTGIREGQNINYAELKEDYIPLPPLEEQEQIAKFLDKKCEKIDKFIAKQLKFIELLKEQKQVLINQVTTKGLNKSTELKDTHIPHLGKIPTHWEVVKLKKIIKTNIGLIFSPTDITDDKSATPVLRSNNIHNGKIVYSDLLYVSGLDIGETNIANNGDLIMCVRNGSSNLVGKTAFVLKDGYAFGAFMAVIRSKYNNFLYWIFQTNMLRKSTYSFAVSSGISQITQADIKNFAIALPPLKEQEKIAKYLDNKCEKIDKAINNITKQISLIQEYKTSLIDTTTKGMLLRELK